MSAIKILSDSLINKIAAGEVVERPASVVKELLENAIDARATQIDISLEEGGKKSILVRDNGCGILPGELCLAVSRHATSKIESAEDLFSIKTLGFRGEALASIASVSKMTITSRFGQNSVGGDEGDLNPAHELRLEGGSIVFEGASAHPIGTSVLVKYLFYQTPARLKFLKSTETEMSYIVDSVTRCALVHPDVAIRLSHNGKKILVTGGEGGLTTAIRSLFDDKTVRQVYSIARETKDISITGVVGHPMISRSHNRNLYLFVNGRPVRDKVLIHAVMEAHRNTLMRGRYPFAIIFINVPGEMVDVNVHPAKAEVRFSNSSLMHNYVQEAVRKVLEGEPWKVKSDLAHVSYFQTPEGSEPFPNEGLGEEGPPSYVKSPTFDNTQDFFTTVKQAVYSTTSFAQLTSIGQIMGTYIVCQADGKLVLIDQHAAHERILFDQLLEQYKEGSIPSQPLLIPENFDLNHSDSEILKKYIKDLELFGLEIEFFGGCTFVVKSVPVLLKRKGTVKELVLDITGEAVERGKISALPENLNGILATMACHSAVRANHHLEIPEMRALLSDLEKYPLTSFCPHGRPVAVEVSKSELERWFKRV